MGNSSQFKHLAFQLHCPIAHGKFVPIKTPGTEVLKMDFQTKEVGGGKIKALEINSQVFLSKTLNTNNQTPKQKEN
jgi:hypothetical protein